MAEERTTVGLTELRRRFGHYLDLVEAGSTVVITRYGKPVAALVPVGWPGLDLTTGNGEG